jgi:hypothetical protein
MRGFVTAILAVLLIVLVVVAAAILIALITGPYLTVSRVNVSVPNASHITNVSAPTMPPDMVRYYELKNISCKTLSKDFLIVARDSSEGDVSGLIEHAQGEQDLAKEFAGAFDSNQTIRTYVRGNSLKRVVINSSGETTTIWKDGHIYECGNNCTMRLLNASDEKEFEAILGQMRNGCADFGRVAMPKSIDMGRLLAIHKGAATQFGPFRCEDFKIYGNATYANEFLNSSAALNEDQKALLWGISHLSGPVEECLDEALGVVVHRNLTLNLTKSYRFDYSPGGYMNVNQETSLVYYQDTVPDSFMGLPIQGG